MNTNKHFCNHCGTELNLKSDYIDLVIEIGATILMANILIQICVRTVLMNYFK